jgi:hypothetical protein
MVANAMSRSQIRIVVVIALAAIAVVIGVTLWLTRGDDKEEGLSHAGYARLYNAATLGQTTIDAAREEWPKPPYQDYSDSAGNHCLEWYDETARILYDLCFNKQGVLASKQTP